MRALATANGLARTRCRATHLLPAFLIAVFGIPGAQAATIDIPFDYPNIQLGMNQAAAGDTVLVQPGRYVENLIFPGPDIVVASLYAVTGDTSYIAVTVLDGSGFDLGTFGSVVTFLSGESPQAELTGFTITNGSGNSWFIDGVAARYGGGVFCQDASPTLNHLRIVGNRGGIGGSLVLVGGGGGLFIADCPGIVLNSVTIKDNLCCSAGGAAYIANSTVDVYNCLTVGNRSYATGTGFCLGFSSQVRVIACTFQGNTADYLGDAIYNSTGTALWLVDSIFWDHPAAPIVLDNNFWPTATAIAYCDLAGGLAGIQQLGAGTLDWLAGNLDEDPRFVAAAAGDFRLAPASPCINAGGADTTGLGVAGVPQRVDLSRLGAGGGHRPAALPVAGCASAGSRA